MHIRDFRASRCPAFVRKPRSPTLRRRSARVMQEAPHATSFGFSAILLSLQVRHHHDASLGERPERPRALFSRSRFPFPRASPGSVPPPPACRSLTTLDRQFPLDIVHSAPPRRVPIRGILRSRSLRAPDAIQLACAAAARMDMFITNDRRLSGKNVAGIHFIQSLGQAAL